MREQVRNLPIFPPPKSSVPVRAARLGWGHTWSGGEVAGGDGQKTPTPLPSPLPTARWALLATLPHLPAANSPPQKTP